MTIAQAFADIALGVSAAIGGGYHPALAKWPGSADVDAGGSIVTPGDPLEVECSVQIDSATEGMRAADGFVDGDVRLLVLSATLQADLDTKATVEVLEGPYAGTSWMLQSVARDPCGIYFECRGRPA